MQKHLDQLDERHYSDQQMRHTGKYLKDLGELNSHRDVYKKYNSEIEKIGGIEVVQSWKDRLDNAMTRSRSDHDMRDNVKKIVGDAFVENGMVGIAMTSSLEALMLLAEKVQSVAPKSQLAMFLNRSIFHVVEKLLSDVNVNHFHLPNAYKEVLAFMKDSLRMILESSDQVPSRVAKMSTLPEGSIATQLMSDVQSIGGRKVLIDALGGEASVAAILETP